MQGASVSIRDVSKSYGAVAALSSLSLEIAAGEFLTLLGPSGCGKSTLLRLIAGFETPGAGTIAIGGRDVEGLRPKERGLSMVFQNYALYPHMSVFENIATPLVMRQLGFWQRFPLLGNFVPGARAKRRSITHRVTDVARLLEIDGLLARRPGQLSGGQRQRVALGRAIIPEPAVFLMDEPLSNLDARLRLQMRNELTELHRKLGITFIYVTHDQVEAMTMSHRIAVIMDGALIQAGRPGEVYSRPADARVARFIGTHPINMLEGTIESSGFALIEGVRLPVRLARRVGEAIAVGIRPEDIRLATSARKTMGALAMDVTVERVEDHGSDLLLHCALRGAPSKRIAARVDSGLRDDVPPRAGAECRLSIAPECLHFFDRSGLRIEALEPWAQNSGEVAT